MSIIEVVRYLTRIPACRCLAHSHLDLQLSWRCRWSRCQLRHALETRHPPEHCRRQADLWWYRQSSSHQSTIPAYRVLCSRWSKRLACPSSDCRCHWNNYWSCQSIPKVLHRDLRPLDSRQDQGSRSSSTRACKDGMGFCKGRYQWHKMGCCKAQRIFAGELALQTSLS